MKQTYFIWIPLLLLCGLIQTCQVSDDQVNTYQNLFSFATVSDDVDLDLRALESSGLLAHKGKLWTHNDGKNESALYRVGAKSGEIEQTIELPIKNVDWEDLTKDDQYLYIGDFGNNLGARQDLFIYKYPRTMLDSTALIVAESIYFSFPDQKEFPGTYDHNFDVESVISYGDSLYVFTKNWRNKRCKLYALPKTSGDYQARFISEFDSKGLITSAAIGPDKSTVYLLGYNYTGVNTPFIWMLSEFEGEDFFSGKQSRYNLDLNRQTEAIEILDSGEVIISAEKAKSEAASLFKVDLSKTYYLREGTK